MLLYHLSRDASLLQFFKLLVGVIVGQFSMVSLLHTSHVLTCSFPFSAQEKSTRESLTKSIQKTRGGEYWPDK